jgi:hypothetical protein
MANGKYRFSAGDKIAGKRDKTFVTAQGVRGVTARKQQGIEV